MSEPLTPERRREIRENAFSLKQDKRIPERYIFCISPPEILALLDALEAAETRIAELEAKCAELDRDSLKYLQETRYDLTVKDELLRGAIRELEKWGIDGPLLRSLKTTVSKEGD